MFSISFPTSSSEKKEKTLESCFTKEKQPSFRMTVFFGGDKRDRTADLLNAIQALSQLSYTPENAVIIAQFISECKHYFCFFQYFLHSSIQLHTALAFFRVSGYNCRANQFIPRFLWILFLQLLPS